VMVTHDPRILEMADRIITLEDGRIVADKTPQT
jgi:putative ABC transport system ATP-binding protein